MRYSVVNVKTGKVVPIIDIDNRKWYSLPSYTMVAREVARKNKRAKDPKAYKVCPSRP